MSEQQRQQQKTAEKTNSIKYVKNDRKLIRCVEFMWMWDNNLYGIWSLHTHHRSSRSPKYVLVRTNQTKTKHKTTKNQFMTIE